MAMILIDDNIHAESQGSFNTFDDAVAELRRRASVPWDQPPNRAPCTSWKQCGREYEIVEYDDSQKPWKELRRVAVLSMSATGVVWFQGFEQGWDRAAPAVGEQQWNRDC